MKSDISCRSPPSPPAATRSRRSTWPSAPRSIDQPRRAPRRVLHRPHRGAGRPGRSTSTRIPGTQAGAHRGRRHGHRHAEGRHQATARSRARRRSSWATRPAAGKTGTYENNTNATFVGFTTAAVGRRVVGQPAGQRHRRHAQHPGVPRRGGAATSTVATCRTGSGRRSSPRPARPRPTRRRTGRRRRSRRAGRSGCYLPGMECLYTGQRRAAGAASAPAPAPASTRTASTEAPAPVYTKVASGTTIPRRPARPGRARRRLRRRPAPPSARAPGHRRRRPRRRPRRPKTPAASPPATGPAEVGLSAMTDLHALLELQHQDTAADQLRHRRADAARAGAGGRPARPSRRASPPSWARRTAEHDRLAADQTRLEGEVAVSEDKRRTLERRLSSTSVPREAQAMSDEIDGLKARQSAHGGPAARPDGGHRAARRAPRRRRRRAGRRRASGSPSPGRP